MWHNQLHIKKTARCVSFSSSSCFPLLEKAAVVECRCCGLGNGEFQSFYYTLDELTEGFGATGLLVFTSAHGRSLPLQVKINKKKLLWGRALSRFGHISVRWAIHGDRKWLGGRRGIEEWTATAEYQSSASSSAADVNAFTAYTAEHRCY